MIFDLDGFKGYNDTFGHPAGDALLARLGAKLAAVPGPTGPRTGWEATSSASSSRSPTQAPSRSSTAPARHSESAARASTSASSFGAVILPEEAADACRRCTSPTSAFTPRSTPGGDESAHHGTRRWTRCPSREPELLAPGHRRRRSRVETGKRLGLARTRSTSSRAPRSSTTSASSPCRTRSCTRPARSTSASGSSSASTRSSASGSCAHHRTWAAWRPSCARATSAGTGRATRTVSRARRFRSPHGSSRPATRSPR